MKKQVAFTLGAGVLLTLALLIYGCDGSSNSPTSTTPVTVPTVEVAATPGPEASPAPAQEWTTPELADGFWQKHVTFDKQGNLSIQNSTESNYDGQVCYFINGPHPQTRLFKDTTHVQAGHFGGRSVPDLAEEPAALALGADSCEPVTVRVQGDAGAGSFDCNNPSGQLADSGTSDLHAYVYFDIEVPSGKEPVEPFIVREADVRWGEWSSCAEEHEGIPYDGEGCFRYREGTQVIAYSDGCKTWQTTEDRLETTPCECPCEVEWIKDTESTYDHDGEWSDCVLGERTQDIFHVYYETNSCTQERRVVEGSEFVYDTRTEECQTPGQCYYKVSGNSEPVKEWICEHTPGTFLPLTFGVWLNFDGGALDNHCQYPTPGVINRIFQLTPGQSDPGCYDKHDD